MKRLFEFPEEKVSMAQRDLESPVTVRRVVAEGLTTIGPHWQERLWNNLKPNFAGLKAMNKAATSASA